MIGPTHRFFGASDEMILKQIARMESRPEGRRYEPKIQGLIESMKRELYLRKNPHIEWQYGESGRVQLIHDDDKIHFMMSML